MFTGLISELGEVEEIEVGEAGAKLRISAPESAAELREGDSIAVNGACLTASEVSEAGFCAEVMNQTLSMTALGTLEPKEPVNLELALPADGRFGGHMVAGHVDGVGVVKSCAPDGMALRLEIEVSDDLMPLVAERGSIAISGVSLTVAGIEGSRVEVSLIPETLDRTNLGGLEVGDSVNIECDLMARHMRRLLESMQP